MNDPIKSKLAQLAAQARAVQSAAPKLTQTVGSYNCAFIGTSDDEEYKDGLKGMFNGVNTYLTFEPFTLLTHLEMYCAKRNVTRVVSTNISILTKLLELQGNIRSNPSLSDYQGSVFQYKAIEIVFISPLRQLHTVPEGKFIASRFISKVCAKESWPEATSFQWVLITPANYKECIHELESSFAIAVDIETLKQNLAIRCIGYTGIYISSTGIITTRSYVLPMDDEWALSVMRRINGNDIQKIFQNGKYDNAYLLRYGSPVTRWLWDTAHQMHSWYSELPKDLAFLNAFFLRKVVYWKDLAETQDLHEYYKYNALDTWATANVWIRWILSAPDWAKRNYSLEFPLVFPCLLSEMTGIKRDAQRLETARKELDIKEAEMLRKLRAMIGAPGFNPGSPVQCKTLLKILGCGDIQGTGVKEMFKARLRHPLINTIISLISIKSEEEGDCIRGLRKLRSNYLRLESDREKNKDNGAKEFQGRILYSLNPHGTETGRLASREHAFWCGLQIQNIPRGKEVKQTICADEGFYLGECDLEQAESRDTANISGDTSLIAAVSGTRDFHSVNASAFFGVPYSDIYDDSIGKTRNKPLRDLAKRVNHGANYNMGALVLIDTMGLDKIWEAARLLGLKESDPKKIAQHLLDQFHKTYPSIKKDYYEHVITEVSTTRMLVSRAYHHTEYNTRHYEAAKYIETGDWTRYCFGRPDKNKLDLNSYVAHCPQSLNARTLNEAYMRVFYEIALKYPNSFRLHAQIHDSILFSYRSGSECLAEQVKKCMEIPVTIRDVSGTIRNFTVPAALKLGMKDKKTGEFIRAKYWSETE